MAVAEQSERTGHYDIAETLWLNAMDTASEFSLRDPRVLFSIDRVADILFKAGELGRARSFFLAAAKLAATIYGDEHITTADSLSRLGMIYYKEESYPAAELCFVHALDIYVSATGVKSDNVIRAQQNLALVLSAQGDLDQAEHQLNQALSTSYSLFGPNSMRSRILRQQLFSLGVNA